MTGYLRGDLIDPDGADELLATAAQSIPVARRLGIPRLNLHGTGLDERGLPVRPVEIVTGDDVAGGGPDPASGSRPSASAKGSPSAWRT